MSTRERIKFDLSIEFNLPAGHILNKESAERIVRLQLEEYLNVYNPKVNISKVQ